MLHARNQSRADDARQALPQAVDVIVGDLSTLDGMLSVADQGNRLGRFSAVLHNVGVRYQEPRRV